MTYSSACKEIGYFFKNPAIRAANVKTDPTYDTRNDRFIVK